jgi:hypothetical protein
MSNRINYTIGMSKDLLQNYFCFKNIQVILSKEAKAPVSRLVSLSV